MTPVLAFAKQINPSVEDADISRLGEGRSSTVYKINTDTPFVVLAGNPTGIKLETYGQAFLMLTLLAKADLGHTPKALALSEDNSMLAMSFADGAPAGQYNFGQDTGLSSKELSLMIVDFLSGLDTVAFDEYQEIAGQYDINAMPPKRIEDWVRRSGVSRVEYVEKNAERDARKYLDYVRPRLDYALELADAFVGLRPVLLHGDLSSDNFLIDTENSTFTLVDWAGARFLIAPPYANLAQALNLNLFISTNKTAVLERFASNMGLSLAECARDVLTFQHDIIAVLDIIYSLWEMTTWKVKGDTERELEAREVLERRIEQHCPK